MHRAAPSNVLPHAGMIQRSRAAPGQGIAMENQELIAVLREIRDDVKRWADASEKLIELSERNQSEWRAQVKEQRRIMGGPWAVTLMIIVCLFLYAMAANIVAEWLRPHLHL
jgi:hypothetical protein